jgi:hypothetical protein
MMIKIGAGLLALFLLAGCGLAQRIQAGRDCDKGDANACRLLSAIHAEDARRDAEWAAEAPLRRAQAEHDAQMQLIRSQTEANEALTRQLRVYPSSSPSPSVGPCLVQDLGGGMASMLCP